MRKVLLFLILFIIPISGVFATKHKWTLEEDNLLLEAVDTSNKNISWEKIAKLIPERTPRQCRDRYSNYLNPKIASQGWTLEEENLLRDLYVQLGGQWKSIASRLGTNRSPNAVKNRYNKLNKSSGGCYKDVKKRAGYQIHHLPSRFAWKHSNMNSLPEGMFPAISIPTNIHKLTKSFGNSPKAKAFRQEEIDAINEAFKTKDADKIVKIMEKGLPTPERANLINSSPVLRAERVIKPLFPLETLE